VAPDYHIYGANGEHQCQQRSDTSGDTDFLKLALAQHEVKALIHRRLRRGISCEASVYEGSRQRVVEPTAENAGRLLQAIDTFGFVDLDASLRRGLRARAA
jgi:hypothetical protein